MESEAHQPKPGLGLQGFYSGPTIASRAPFKAAGAGEPEQWVPVSPEARKRRGGEQLGGSRQGTDEAEPLLQRNPADAGGRVHPEAGDRPRQMDRSASERDADHVEAHFSPPQSAMPHQMTILGLVFLDLFAVGLAMPLVVPLIKDLGADPIELGMISSTYGIVQMFSGPFMGLLSDRRGRRLVILASCVGTSLGYFLLGQSTTIMMVAISRVVTGLVKHSINATKSYIADHTAGTSRAIELGRMATASGLGIMVGPTVGGFLFKLNGYWLPTTLASAIYIINAGIVLWRLPPNELPPATQRAASAAAAAAIGGEAASKKQQLLPRVAMLARPRVAALFAVRALLGLAIQVFRQGFHTRLIYSFKLSVQANGLLLSYQGALTSLVQGFAIKPLVQRYNDEPLILRGMLLLSLSFVACALSPSVVLVALTLTPVALCQGVLRTTYTAILTASVPPAEVGQLLGLSDAVMSGCRVIGPTLAGLIALSFGHVAPGILSGIFTALATVAFQLFVHRRSMDLVRDHGPKRVLGRSESIGSSIPSDQALDRRTVSDKHPSRHAFGADAGLAVIIDEPGRIHIASTPEAGASVKRGARPFEERT